MRELVADPAEARRRASRGREDVARAYSPQVAGAAAAARLGRVAGLPGGGAGPTPAVALDELELRMRRPPPEPAEDARLSSMRRALQGAVLRAIRMHTTHRRQVDEELLAVLRGLDERVRGLAAEEQALHARLDTLERRLEREENGA